jgi:hypothetical protein
MKQPPLSGNSEGGGDGEGQCISSSRKQHNGLCEINPMTNESLVVGANNATVQPSREGLRAGRRQSEIIRCNSEIILPEPRRATIDDRKDVNHLLSQMKEVVPSSPIIPALPLFGLSPSVGVLEANILHETTADLHLSGFKNLDLDGGRRLRRRSISTPEFCMLVASDPLDGGVTNFPSDYRRPPSTERRSLSPERSSSLGANSLPQQTADQLNGLNSDHSNGGVRSSQRSSSVPRRQTMPEQIHNLINLGDVMDSNALRYLPKILRDVYAQRQTKRPSLVSSLFFH